MTQESSIYDEIAKAIGDVCLTWAEIEQVVHDIILHIAAEIEFGWGDDKSKGWDLLDVALSQMELRHKLATAKVYAEMLKATNPANFFDRAERLFNYIDNECRPERNRYIHDYWETQSTEIVRGKLGATVYRPQSRQRIISIWSERRFKDLPTLREFEDNLRLVYEDLVTLDNQIGVAHLPSEPPEVPTQQLPPEWKSLAHHGWRGPSTHQPLP